MISLPPWIDLDAWQGFVEMRRVSKHPLTPRAAKLILGDLDRIRGAGHCPNAALDQSTLCCWRGVWPAKEKMIERAPESSAAYVERMRAESAAERARVSAPRPEVAAKLAELAGHVRRVA